jgi:hypothetical protein
MFALSWLRSKETGKSFREAVLPYALLAVAGSIFFVREFFGDLPLWIDVPIVVLCGLIILILLGLGLFRLKRHLQGAWRLEDKKDK